MEEDSEALAAVEIHIDVPDTKRGMKKFVESPTAYFCQKLKREQVEVNERRLKPEELEQFRQAKSTEVRNFVAAECFKAW